MLCRLRKAIILRSRLRTTLSSICRKSRFQQVLKADFVNRIKSGIKRRGTNANGSCCGQFCAVIAWWSKNDLPPSFLFIPHYTYVHTLQHQEAMEPILAPAYVASTIFDASHTSLPHDRNAEYASKAMFSTVPAYLPSTARDSTSAMSHSLPMSSRQIRLLEKQDRESRQIFNGGRSTRTSFRLSYLITVWGLA